MGLYALYILSISPQHVLARQPGDTSALRPGDMVRDLTSDTDLSHLSLFQRSSTKSMWLQNAKQFAEKTAVDGHSQHSLNSTSSSSTGDKMTCVRMALGDGVTSVAAVAVSDPDYPPQVMVRFLQLLLKEYTLTCPDEMKDTSGKVVWPELRRKRLAMQDPMAVISDDQPQMSGDQTDRKKKHRKWCCLI